jgi:uncharacterized membrane protein
MRAVVDYLKYLLKFTAYVVAYISLWVLIGVVSALGIGKFLLEVVLCSGMGCFGEGILALVGGCVSGFVISSILMLLVVARLEFWALPELPEANRDKAQTQQTKMP